MSALYAMDTSLLLYRTTELLIDGLEHVTSLSGDAEVPAQRR